MLDLLKKLCLLGGVSGDEDKVRDFIISEIKDYCECEIDSLGSIIAFKNGKKIPKKKIMVCAHMDEVGFVVTGITDDGYLNFTPVGGIDPRTVFGTVVKIGSIKGVIGGKAVHHLTAGEKDSAPQFKDMLIDIGAKNKDNAAEFVSLGDFACFESEFNTFGDGFIKGKAIDDRAGCAIMISMIKEDTEYDAYYVFNVQEEVGLRGAKASAYSVNPDAALVIEATTAADLSGVDGDKRVCVLGNGATVSFMDGRTIYNKELYRTAIETAEESNIKCQSKTAVAGGNDSGSIHLSRCGVPTLAVSVPCRYIHTPSCVVKESDLYDVKNLVCALMKKLYD